VGIRTTTPTVDFEVNGLAKLGNANIVPLYVFTSHTFTNAGATGRLGPTLANVRSAYSGVSWAQNNSYLSMTNDNGIQLWTVPLSGNYTIRAKGAAGLDTRGGKGRDIQLTTTLVKGEVIRILVGQQGTGASGGGGTFVVRGTDTPIIVAGGGGGLSDLMTYPSQEPFSDAGITTSGKGTPYGYNGGVNGGGGVSGSATYTSQSSGGGFYGNGTSGGGFSFTNGGFGGEGTNNGGFGGGGADTNYQGGAGGGGYSGGGAGGRILGMPNGVNLTWDNIGGGGGGSFGITTLTDFGAINTDHGSVTITLTTPSVALEVIGVAVVTGSSATSTALTTTGRIGVNTAAPTVDLDVNGTIRVNTGFILGTDQYELMRINSYGWVGIGTNNPLYPIDIVSYRYEYLEGFGRWWGKSSSGTSINWFPSGFSNVPISMRLNASVWIDSQEQWAGFYTTSDRRIKKNINYNISAECLNLFRQLKCSNYSYIDERANKTNVYGYIAQDVSTVIPYAVTTQKGFIPSLYSLSKISKENGIIKLTCSEQKTYTFYSLHDKDGKAFTDNNNDPASDNEGGRHFKVKLYDVSMNEYIVRINEIIDNGIFTIENDETSIKLTHEEYFVYGQEVDDYKILNNEAIAMVATAALQEVDRQQQADKARIAELEATVASQQSLINDILERLKKHGI